MSCLSFLPVFLSKFLFFSFFEKGRSTVGIKVVNFVLSVIASRYFSSSICSFTNFHKISVPEILKIYICLHYTISHHCTKFFVCKITDKETHAKFTSDEHLSYKVLPDNAERHFLQQSLKYANFHSHIRGDCLIGRGVI